MKKLYITLIAAVSFFSFVQASTKMSRDLKFDFNDIVIIPSKKSSIKSRKDIDILNEQRKLPIFVAPMDTVVDEQNYQLFLDQDLYVCVPRGIYTSGSEKTFGDSFISIGLHEAEEMYKKGTLPLGKLLIDVANGHVERVRTIAAQIKETYNDKIELMIGNIANPETYTYYAEIGVDWIRCGIGGGQVCLTSANTGVHYPMASLISECYTIKKKNNYKTRIVADGGFKNFDEINKALALGADAVMLGGIFNKCIEACGTNWIFDNKTNNYIELKDKNIAEELLKRGGTIYKSYRGMSTKEVQAKWGKKQLTTSEGISKFNRVEYRLAGWVENFKDYLRSAMSYTNAPTLHDFVGSVDYVFITYNALHRFKK